MAKIPTPVTGGEKSISDENAARRGVFAQFPAMSPKYNTRPGHDEETMARLLIPVPASARDTWNKACKSLPNEEIVELSSILGYWGDVNNEVRTYQRGYIDFLLQRAQESFQEKFQAVELQGDNYTSYFFGQKPPIFQYSGILLNTLQNDWRKAMTLAYLHLLRGTKLAQRKIVMAIAYDEMVVVGSMINLSQVFTSDRQIASDFSFSILVKKIQFRALHSKPTRVRTNIGYIKLSELMSVPVEDVKRNIKTVTEPPVSSQKVANRAKTEAEPALSGYEVKMDEKEKYLENFWKVVSDGSKNLKKILSLGIFTE
jgi:hypothetical protein